MKARAKIIVFGAVQGVSFRYYARQMAQKLDLAGWVQNKPNSTVYIEAEGKKENIERFIAWCKQGSPLAQVEKVEYKLSSELRGFIGFIIKI